jgi:hypothetical protein
MLQDRQPHLGEGLPWILEGGVGEGGKEDGGFFAVYETFI